VKTVVAWVLALLVVIGTGVGVEACTGGSHRSPSFGTVCGYEPNNLGIVDKVHVPSPDTACPRATATADIGTAAVRAQLAVTIIADTGKKIVVYPSEASADWAYWSVSLPPGSYHAVGWACPWSVGTAFVLRPGQTLQSVMVGRGCWVS
jgi:hypothetical protein